LDSVETTRIKASVFKYKDYLILVVADQPSFLMNTWHKP